jgi:signal transduction histidine kinase/CheY-like chemotaxis protein
MAGKKISFYILAAFIAGTILLVYIQYNSSKHIDTLVKGNEKLMDEFKVNAELKELEKDIITVDSKIRGAVSTKNPVYIEGLDSTIVQIKTDLVQLQKITGNDSSAQYIDDLDTLVQLKVQSAQLVLNSFQSGDRQTAENVITGPEGKRLTDSIVSIVQKIDSTRKKHLADTTISLDKSGEKAQRFSTVLIVLVLVSGAGLFWYIINIIRKQISLIHQLNISEKKVKETARIKENFMANMSHEIRTPMNAILGFTNLLQRKTLDNESKEYVKTIQKSGENLLTLINDILDLSKIEAGMMRIESAPFSIRGLLHSVEAMFKSKANEKQLKLSVHIDESLPDTLEGDPVRLTQILVNLIGNALKFTNTGSISVKVTHEGHSGDTIKTGIAISDTGIGIEKDKLENIFERFQQAEDSVTRKYGGTGLGLSIVSELVSLLQGNIRVESDTGKGTTFILIIPYKISDGQFDIPAPSIKDQAVLPDFDNIRVLVVEDNEINQVLIKHLFTNWQLGFAVVNNGREAVARLGTTNYNLILMDIQMPEMDGYTATQEIRNRLRLDTPIIAMTAHALAGEREKCLSYGMNEYISKPIREEQLLKLIAQFTQPNKRRIIPAAQAIHPVKETYRYIDLRYMKEISNGDRGYEKTVTGQFIEAIPADLIALDKAWQGNDVQQLKKIVHNMKTSVSIMGLDESLHPHLDAIEYEQHDKHQLLQRINTIKNICSTALTEARSFLETL